jgi:MSHA pilin protein MshC
MSLQEKNARGFTLIELVVVIVLLAVLGVIALARVGDTRGMANRAFFDEVVSALRYAQKLAISTGCNVQVVLTATGYALHQGQASCTDTTYTRAVLDPANRRVPYSNSDANASITPTATFEFTSESTVTGLALDQTFTVNGLSFQVYRMTGLVNAL